MKSKMARIVSVSLALVMLLALMSGCAPAGVSQEEYDRVVAERDAAKEKAAQLESKLEAAQAEVSRLEKELAAAKGERPTPEPMPAPTTITITDSAGREIELPFPLERVVVLNPPAAEVIHALGATDKVIGVSEPIAGVKFMPEFSAKAAVARHAHGEPDYEKIIELKPQLVITYGTHPAVDIGKLAETLAPARIKVAGIDCYKLGTLFNEIGILGKLFGKEEEASKLVDFLQEPAKIVESRTKDLKPEERVKVYAEHHGKDYLAFGPGSEWHTIIEKAGGANIFADARRPYVEVDPEKIIKRDPQVILKDVRAPKMGYGVTEAEPMKEHLEGFIKRPGWENLEAVKEGKVYLVSSTLGAGLGKAFFIPYLAKILHPELFEDLDPQSLLRKYYKRFHNAEFEGVVIYPEP